MNSSSPLLCQRMPQALFWFFGSSSLLEAGCGASAVVSSAFLVAVDLSASSFIEDGSSLPCFEPTESVEVAAAVAVAAAAARPSLLPPSFLRSVVDKHPCGPSPSILSRLLCNQGILQHSHTFAMPFLGECTHVGSRPLLFFTLFYIRSELSLLLFVVLVCFLSFPVPFGVVLFGLLLSVGGTAFLLF